MAETFTRADGIRFVADSYREVYANQYGAQIKKNILGIANTLYDGKSRSFAVIRKLQNGSIQAVLNDTRGYLLGESVLRYLQKSGEADAGSNIIWSERLPSDDGSSYAAIVIVIAGEVVYDAVSSVDYVDLNALNIIDSSDQQFEVIVNGDLPLFEFDNEAKQESGELYIDNNKLYSFRRYEQSIVPVIPIVREFKLVTVGTAIARRGFLSKGVLFALSIVTVLVVLAFLYYILKPDVSNIEIEVPQPFADVLAPEEEVDPFEGYKRELQTPSIGNVVEATLDVYENLSLVKGIRIDSFDVNGTLASASLSVLEDGPLYSLISEELAKQGWNATLAGKTFIISRGLFLPNRPEPTFIMSTGSIIESLLDSMSSLNVPFEYSPGVVGQAYQTTNASVSLVGGNDEIKVIADILSKYPTVAGRIIVSSSSLVSSQLNLEFTIYGDGS